MNFNHTYWESNKVKLYCGDSLEILKTFPDECIQMVMCSPPYYGLRDYKVDKQIGLEKTPQEYLQKLWTIFDEIKRVLKKDGVIWVNLGDTYGGSGNGSWNAPIEIRGKQYRKCLNIDQEYLAPPRQTKTMAKCLLLIPERFAIGMVEGGWILRNRICWYKRNAMPSSVKDRFTCCWEYIYFFSKSRRYYFDLDAVRVPLKQSSIERMRYPLDSFSDMCMPKVKSKDRQKVMLIKANNKFNYRVRDTEKKSDQCPQFKASEEEIEKYKALGYQNPHRAGRDYKDPQKSVQAKMEWYQHKTNWREEASKRGQLFDNPVAHQGGGNTGLLNYRNKTADQSYKVDGMRPCPEPNDPKYKNREYTGRWGNDGKGMVMPEKYNVSLLKNPGDHWDITTRGFKGAHFAVYPEALCLTPIKAGSKPGDIVLDPFVGSGTTGVVALKLGRKFIGIDLSPKYLTNIAIPRLEREKSLF